MSVPVEDQKDFLETLESFQSQWRDAEYMTAFIKKEQVFYREKK